MAPVPVSDIRQTNKYKNDQMERLAKAFCRFRWGQRMNMVGSPNPILADDTCISEELIGCLHHATKESVLDLVAAFRANERVRLAMYCYRKCHLRWVGLVIAATCDLNSLVREWGLVLGEAIFAQSREESGRIEVRRRPKITLARSAGRYYPPPIDLDDVEPPRSGALREYE